MTLRIKKLNDDAIVPRYQTDGASGFDLHSATETIINPNNVALIPTGLSMEIPTGYEVQIRPRSGLAARNMITVLNTPGTIDSDYRGEIKVLLINLSNSPYRVSKGDRIAQGVLVKVERANFELTEDLSATDRNTGGFGSTGI